MKKVADFRNLSWNDARAYCEKKGQRLMEPIYLDYQPLLDKWKTNVEKHGWNNMGYIVFIGIYKNVKVSKSLGIRTMWILPLMVMFIPVSNPLMYYCLIIGHIL